MNMILKTMTVPALFLLLPAGAARAADSGWTQSRSGALRCSALAGHYEQREVPPMQPGQPVTFRFSLVRQNFDPKWAAGASIRFETPTGRAEIDVASGGYERHTIYVVLRSEHGGHAAQAVIEEFSADVPRVVVYTEMDSKGVVHVTSGGGKASLNIGTAAPVKTLLQCQSGVFEVEISPPQASGPPVNP